MQKSIEDSQAEAKDLNSKLAATTSKLTEVTSQQEATHCALQRAQQGLAELQRRHIKLEAQSAWKFKIFRHNLDRTYKSQTATQKTEKLRNFMITGCVKRSALSVN